MRLKSFGLRLRDRYRDWTILVSIDKTDTETYDTQSKASRLKLKSSLKAKIETITEIKNKHKEDKLSNQVKVVSCFIEPSLNESLSFRDFWKSVSAFETETLGSQSQFRERDWETADGRD